jgi:hypothetical protein
MSEKYVRQRRNVEKSADTEKRCGALPAGPEQLMAHANADEKLYWTSKNSKPMRWVDDKKHLSA